MSCYEDALLMDECWDAYLSSFSFVSSGIQDDRFKNMVSGKKSQEFNQPTRIGTKKDSSKEASSRKGKGQSSSNLNYYRDSLAFTVQSKLYVLELNLEKKLVNFKSFLRNHSPAWLRNLQGNKRNECKWSPTFTGKESREEALGWASGLEPGSSRKSLGAQKEKILTRLEQVLQAKRSGDADGQLFNMELHDGRYNPMVPLRSSSSYSLMSKNQAGSGFGKSRTTNTKSTAKQKTVYSKRRARWIPRSATWLSSESVTRPEQKRLCAICYTNPPNIVTLPCSHHEMCSDCFMEIIYMAVKQSQYPLKCVICRQKIERIRCSRKLLLNFIQKNRLHP